MKKIGVRSDSDSKIRSQILNFNRLVNIDYIFALVGKFNKDSAFSHNLNNLTNKGINFLKRMKLFF